MAYDPSPDMNQSACNAHPHGCGDEPHPRPDFMGFLRTVPGPFTRAEIQALRRRAYGACGMAEPGMETTEEKLFLQLAETLDLLDAVMAREEAAAMQPCPETVEPPENRMEELQEELARWWQQYEAQPQGCPTCACKSHQRVVSSDRRFNDDWDGPMWPC